MRDEAIGADDVDHAPAGGKRHADLRHARIARAGGGIDLLTQRNLLREGHEAERIVGAVHRLVGACRRRSGFALARVQQLQGGGGALDRRFADLVGVGEGGGLAGYAAEAEPGGAVVIGGLQPPVVEAEGLADTVLEIKLAVVLTGEVPVRQTLGAVGIEIAIEEVPWIGGDHACLSAGPPMSTKRRSQ